jgi:Fe-S cluster assembly protein SufD
MNQVIEQTALKPSFQQLQENLPGVDSLVSLNKTGAAAFERSGIPAVHHEEWKYTPVASHHPETFLPATPFSGKSEKIGFHLDGAIMIVLRNGYFDAELSSKELSAEGISVTQISRNTPALLGTIAPAQEQPFVALNSALCRDGISIHISKNAKPSSTVCILHISDSTEVRTMTSPRLLIVAEPGSESEIAEVFLSGNDHTAAWTNSVAEILVKENAILKMVKAQLENNFSIQTDFTQALQEANSTFDIVTVTLGGKLVRNNLHIRHTGTNCTSHLFGLYVAGGEQLIDNHTLVDHALPHCYSNELYKGVIGGKATGVFNGKIFVRKDAQKTNAYQSNKTILLTDDAQMNAKPQLEIFADDVKCTHGATTGQLDDEALFYLRTRGIGEQSARTLLNIAFAQDVLNNITNESLLEQLTKLVTEKLTGADA